MNNTINKKLKMILNGKYSKDNQQRFSLNVHWETDNTKTAVAIGINPSKANNKKSDNSITRFSRFLDANGYCQFTMLNLFSSYSTKQDGIITSTQTNWIEYMDLFSSVDDIFIIWGVDDNYQVEKNEAIGALKPFQSKLKCICNAKGSYPMHPSRIAYTFKIIAYPIKMPSYL